MNNKNNIPAGKVSNKSIDYGEPIRFLGFVRKCNIIIPEEQKATVAGEEPKKKYTLEILCDLSNQKVNELFNDGLAKINSLLLRNLNTDVESLQKLEKDGISNFNFPFYTVEYKIEKLSRALKDPTLDDDKRKGCEGLMAFLKNYQNYLIVKFASNPYNKDGTEKSVKDFSASKTIDNIPDSVECLGPEYSEKLEHDASAIGHEAQVTCTPQYYFFNGVRGISLRLNNFYAYTYRDKLFSASFNKLEIDYSI